MIQAAFVSLLRNTSCGHQLESRGRSLLLQSNELPVAGPCFEACEDAFVVWLACRGDVVENPGELVDRGCDSCRSAETGSQVTKILPRTGLARMQRLGGLAESHGEAINDLAGFRGQESPAINLIVWTEAQPEGKCRTVPELAKIRPTSVKKTWAVKLLTPGPSVRSMPKTRYRWVRKRGSLRRGL